MENPTGPCPTYNQLSIALGVGKPTALDAPRDAQCDFPDEHSSTFTDITLTFSKLRLEWSVRNF